MTIIVIAFESILQQKQIQKLPKQNENLWVFFLPTSVYLSWKCVIYINMTLKCMHWYSGPLYSVIVLYANVSVESMKCKVLSFQCAVGIESSVQLVLRVQCSWY